MEHKKEIELILLGVLKEKTQHEKEMFDLLLREEIDWGFVAGQLFHHRLIGYFYFGLIEEQKYCLFPELRKYIELLVQAQKKVMIDTYRLMENILKDMENKHIRYACLKGLVFCSDIYSIGERRSNDCDLLVLESDLTKLDEILRNRGFVQTFRYDYIEATKKEKVIQRLNHHDLVPYVKKVENDLFDKIKIDINFRFNCREDDITQDIYDFGLQDYKNKICNIRGLMWETHFLHLCSHYYREASQTLWIEKKLDIPLYKLIDVINTWRKQKDENKKKNMLRMAKSFSLENECIFVLNRINFLYKNEISEDFFYVLGINNDVNKINEMKISFLKKSFDLNFMQIFK